MLVSDRVSPDTCRRRSAVLFFFFNDTATTEIYTLSLHDALPIYFFDGLDAAVDAAVRAAARILEGLGAEIVSVRVPDPRPVVDVSNVIARAESAAVHARIARERPHELQPAVRARLEGRLHLTAHDYLQALRLPTRYARVFVAEVFSEVDPLL